MTPNAGEGEDGAGLVRRNVGGQMGVSEAYASVSRLGAWSAHFGVHVGSQQPYRDLVGCE